MLRFARHFAIVILFLLIAGCTGGGCASGCSCSGITPLAQGFDPDHRVQNAASARITTSGLAFLEQNAGAIVSSMLGEGGAGTLSFPFGPMDGEFGWSVFTIYYSVCPDGPDENANPPECTAEIDLANADLQIDPINPHNLSVHGALPLRIQKLPIRVTYIVLDDNTTMALNGNNECPNNAQTFAAIDLSVDISIEIDNDVGHSRRGYTRIRVNDIAPDSGQLSDSIHFCGGGFTSGLLNALKGVLLPLFLGSLTGTLEDSLEQQLCQPANLELDPPCPDGTQNVDGICRYGPTADAECASILFGMDGTVDLGALLAAFSPGTSGTFDFIFAAGGHGLRDDGSSYHWGDLNPIGAGATLGLYGGVLPQPVSDCVPLADVELPDTIPIPDELYQNALSGWDGDGPHFGLAISETFFNYALAQIYNSGALCLGITGDAIAQLNTNLLGLGLGAPSLSELGRMRESAEVALVVRPQSPPEVQFGNGTDSETDPLIDLTMNDLAIDFYVWSLDRYIRAMTVTIDVRVPANLTVTPDGLQPAIETIEILQAEVTNSSLVREDPAAIATAIQDLVGSMVGSLLADAFSPIDINASLEPLGLHLLIPATVEGQGSQGLRRLTKGNEDYLGIFAAFEVVSTARAEQADTTAEIESFDQSGYLMNEPGTPTAVLRLGSSLDDGAHNIEWQVRIDHQPWRPFHTARYAELQGGWLRQQGRHLIQARSRVVGDVMSLDPTPAAIEILIDHEPPKVRVEQDDEGGLLLQASDAVSPITELEARARFGVGQDGDIAWEDWSEWTRLDGIAALDTDGAQYVQVEVRDEEGNVGTVQQALIRGRGSDDATGCQCALGGATPAPRALGWLGLMLAGLAVYFRRRRARRLPRSWRTAGAVLLCVFGTGLASGCSCSDEAAQSGCRFRGDCLIIEPGLIGAYSSAAVAPDGTLWVAGYLEGNWAEEMPFGDLVVGPYRNERVEWRVVDGVPADAVVNPELYDPLGFRGGITDAGDDVGLWTSLAIAPDGMPAVAYYDATNRALRYAHLQGGAWATAVVDQRVQADLGRYAKLLFVDGRPTIAYLFIEPGEEWAIASGVRIATGSAAGAEAQWGFEDAFVNPATPCQIAYCASGTYCVPSTGRCESSSSDCSGCGGTEECVLIEGTAQCATVAASGLLESYPDASGLYVSAAPHPAGGIGLAFYDRVRGNLMVARQEAGTWAAIIADGELPDGTDLGDVGIGASLAIDPGGHYHVAYVDGIDEALRYQLTTDGTTPTTPIVVDDGMGIDGEWFTDGKHIVGDDPSLVVTQAGDIRISYQDASSGTLRLAVGQGSDFSRSVVVQDGFAGFFSRQIDIGGSLQILNWWRIASPSALGEVRLLPPP